jgi:formylglycine-generating enzyme required for sulfatase activity
VELFAVEARSVLSEMQQARNPLNILILDACRDSPLPSTEKSAGSKGLARMDAPSGSVIAFATAPGKTASDNNAGRNGLYTKHLIAAINTPGLRLEDVFKRVGAAVEKESASQGGDQSPEEVMKLRAEQPFYFRLASIKPEPVPFTARPGQMNGLSLEDLQKEEETRQAWTKWQAQMKADFDKTAKFAGSADLQAKAWQRFLAAWAQDNPLSRDDEALRLQANTRLQQAQQQSLPAQAAVQTTAPASAPVVSKMVPGIGQTLKECAQCPELVVLPGGTFTMGSSAAEQALANAGGIAKKFTDRESPQHSVSIKSFAAGKYAVSRGEFGAFVQTTRYVTEAEKGDGCYVFKDNKWQQDKAFNWRNVGYKQEEDHPVVCVSWNDAQAYARWISQISGKPYRLLSEAEREYAARAGSQTAFWWGESISTAQANYGGTGPSYNGSPQGEWRRATVAVSSFKPNPFGLYNMHGNVSEWVEDCFHDSYSGAPSDGSAWTTSCSGDYRVLRGGSWINYPAYLRSPNRNSSTPDNRINGLGFRLARTLLTP